MKRLLYILLFVPLALFAQDEDPCYSVNDYNVLMQEQNPLLTMDLNEGWNMIGYPCFEPMQVEDALISIVDELLILKDNYGDVYWPEYGFNGIGSLKQLNGYQINLDESVESFSFCNSFEIVERFGCTDCEAFNFDIWATLDDGSCEAVVEGCTDAIAFNYNASANTDDGSCEALVVGCSDITAINFNVEANIDDGTCMFNGCTDANYFEYNILASQDNGSCQTLKIYGCIYPLAINFNENANTEDGSCVFYETPTGETNGGDCDFPEPFEGNTGSHLTVMLTTAFITSLDATEENAYMVALTESGLVVGSEAFYGVTQTSLAVWGNDSQTTEVDGASANEAVSFQLVNGTDLYDVVMPTAVSFTANGLSIQNAAAILIPVDCQSYACPYDVYLEYMSNADNYDIVYCVNLIVEGCTGEMYFEFNPDANVEDGSCLTLIVEGCTDINYAEYSAEANTDDGSCLTLAISGCTNPDANNYNPNANTDDGSCIVLGCMQMTAANYNTEATENDGSCIYYGCINSTAENFELSANTDDGSCIIYGCALSVFPNYNSQATIDDGSCDFSSTDVFGCTDSEANNYNELATLDNGSCDFSLSIAVGDLAEGGIVFYVDETGEHGLVAAMEDLTEGATDPYGLGFNGYEWGCYSENVSGADGQAIGTGYQNTMDIVNHGCVTDNGGITAAQAALDAEINGYSDWYLPSKDELYEMYSTIGNEGLEGNIGGFDTSDWPYYWSSSEGNNHLAWSVGFDDGYTFYYNKNNTYRVRVIRAF